jgi:hypothetical protein
VAVTITAITAVAATSVEVGHVYYAYQQLVESTNQSALAGAQAMSNALTSTASTGAYTAAVTSAVKQYSSVAGQLNATSYLQSDAIATQTLFCSTVMEAPPFDVVCQLPPGSTTGYNAIKVVQTATVPLWFGGLVGMPSMNLAATATASMKGAANTPYNLAVIMDTTNSMSHTISGDTNCTSSQISCAVAGLESMLSQLDPCELNTTCTSATVDNVALFVFPALSVNNSLKNYHSDYCGSGAATVPYNFINVTPGWLDPLTNLKDGLDMEASTSVPNTNAGAYGIIPFNTIYKTNDSAGLTISSALAEAVGRSSGSSCNGLSAPGGQQTYYAQVIYTAQQALATQQASNPNSKNIMIILSDGDATACASNANTAAGACNSAAQIVADNNPTCALAVKTFGNCLNGTGTSTTNPNTTVNGVSVGYQSYTYPSALGECGQAVQAAQQATKAGTMVYTIGFGSETSGCASDGTFTASITSTTDGAEAWPGGSHPKTPCNAIAAMASNQNTFYSDASGGCPALTKQNADFSSLVGIFDAITTGLTSPRLIPNGTN